MKKLIIAAIITMAIILGLGIAYFTTSSKKTTEETISKNSLTVLGVPLVGENKDDVLQKWDNEVEELEFVESSNYHVANFCDVPFGVNIEWETIGKKVFARNVTLMTSKQDIQTFKRLKDCLIRYYGCPDTEDDYSCGDDMFYGRCCWYGECGITVRNVHSDNGGLILMFH